MWKLGKLSLQYSQITTNTLRNGMFESCEFSSVWLETASGVHQCRQWTPHPKITYESEWSRRLLAMGLNRDVTIVEKTGSIIRQCHSLRCATHWIE